MSESKHSADLLQSLQKVSGALQVIAQGREHEVIRFTGVWSYLGSESIGALLDEANSAIAKATEGRS